MLFSSLKPGEELIIIPFLNNKQVLFEEIEEALLRLQEYLELWFNIK